mmetsp:Transcript_37015/g.78943  ORF Transcript_37015/g.78943 Transcript_37015/m.78943 type:complete len:99 (-) Transcript_37015:692-988(-)
MASSFGEQLQISSQTHVPGRTWRVAPPPGVVRDDFPETAMFTTEAKNIRRKQRERRGRRLHPVSNLEAASEAVIPNAELKRYGELAEQPSRELKIMRP